MKSGALKGVTLAGPFVAAIAWVALDPRPNEPMLDRMTSAVGLYMCAIGLIAAIAALANRWRSKV